MNKKLVISIGKWVAMGILMSLNFFFYMINDEKMNLILAVAIILYSFYEFFYSISKIKVKLGFKLYLFTFYTLALLSLFMSIKSFLNSNYMSAGTGFVLMLGDAALLVYTTYRLSHPEKFR